MRDRDVRGPLLRELVSTHDKETLIVDEFGLCQGGVRVDIAVINGALNGFEIKSESDTLDRLPAQQSIYSKVLDTVTILAGEKHIENILRAVPRWWAVREAILEAGRVVFLPVRDGMPNPQVDSFALAQLLWRDEALSLVYQLGFAMNISRKPRREIWRILADNLPSAELGVHVRSAIRNRVNWRSAT
jgi:hypothetical protein